MAATELAGPVRRGGRAWHAWRRAYLAIWSLTLAGAVAVAAIPGAGDGARTLLSARLSAAGNPPPAFGAALALAALNLPVASWPLLLGALGAQRKRRSRRAADCLVGAALSASALPVGAALGAYGTKLLPYVPQLPLEWAALACGTSGWLLQRRGALSRRAARMLVALATLAVLGAAVLETWCVPHR